MKTSALAALAALACTAAQGQDAAPHVDAARDAYDRGHYRSAFEIFAVLADQGHCEAARIAAQMARWGRPLYALTFDVSDQRRQQWPSPRACAAAATASTAAAATTAARP